MAIPLCPLPSALRPLFSDIVHRINSRIREVGADKVAALEKIKSFRKRINYMVWESGYLKAKVMCLPHNAPHRLC